MDSVPGILRVLPLSSLMDTRGLASGSLDSMSTLVENPVTSSSCSCMVTPSTMSPNFTRPDTSVRMGRV